MKESDLNRHLNPINVWAMAFGCIIGWGAFVMPGTQFLPTAGTFGTTIAMIVGALVMTVIAFSYSYMVPRYPEAGGEFTFAKECFGPRHAYFCGWFLALAYVAPISMNCTALGLMTRKLFFGVFQFGRMYTVAGYDIWAGEILLSLVTLSLITLLSVRGIRKAGWVQTAMALSLAGAFLVIVVSAIFSPVTCWANLRPFWGHSAQMAPSGIWHGILAVVAVAPWAYIGFDTIPQAAEEFNFSARRVNVVMIGAIAFGCLVYSCNSLVTAAASPDWTEFVKSHDWAVGAAVEALMGRPGLVVLGVAVSCAILTGILGFLTATSRILYAMARDGYVPTWFAHVNPRHRTPSHAIAFCFAVSVCGPFFGRTALGWFVDMSAVGGAVGFGYACASCLATAVKENSSWNVRILSALGLLVSLGFCVLLLVPGLPGCLGTPSFVMLGIWTAVGLALYSSRASAVSRAL